MHFEGFLNNTSKSFWYLHQLKCGTSLEDIWKVKESDSAISTGNLTINLMHMKINEVATLH